ncbi:hypothetical protein AB6A40_002970, partial [Gnathostoma spinigerum]
MTCIIAVISFCTPLSANPHATISEEFVSYSLFIVLTVWDFISVGMGVKGLWTLLEPTAEPVTLESLEGKKLAIDISIWLHQATHGYANFQSSTKFPHLLLLLSRIAKLLFYNIHPVFVFDGPRVPMFKRKILRDRQVKRYLDELTLSKSQKKALESIASTCQGEAGTTHDDLNKMSNNMPKAQNDANDIFNIPSISSAETSHQPKLSDDDGEHSWDFVESVMDRLESDDDRIEYLTAAKERAKHIHFSTDKVPDESKSFSEFQMRRLLKRNLINDQLEMQFTVGVWEKLFRLVKLASVERHSVSILLRKSQILFFQIKKES